MSDEIKIDGFLNNTFQNIENSNIEVTQILVKSFEYNDLLDKIKTKQKLFDRTPENETEERLQLSAEINQLKETFEQFKRDVTALAETFNKIEINTDRLRRAKEFFDQGAIGEARAVLETELEQMQDEQTHLLKQKEHYETEVLPNLINNSEEFMVLALATQLDYENSNRFEDTCSYFEESIKSYKTDENHFYYAVFLQQHNQLDEAEQMYLKLIRLFSNKIEKGNLLQILNNLAIIQNQKNEFENAIVTFNKALKIAQQLIEKQPSIFKPIESQLLNNLGVLYFELKKYKKAERYLKQSIKINKDLSDKSSQILLAIANNLTNLGLIHIDEMKYSLAQNEYTEALNIFKLINKKSSNKYLPEIATAYNNLAVLWRKTDKKKEALAILNKALRIRKKLAKENPKVYLLYYSRTLGNIGNILSDLRLFNKAKIKYLESLKIDRKLLKNDEERFSPHLAATLNNLANTYCDLKLYEKAKKEYLESLRIRQKLFSKYGIVYLPDLATSMMNISVFYQQSMPDRDLSVNLATNLLILINPFIEKIPKLSIHYVNTLNILNYWGLSDEEISQMIAERVKGNE